MVDNIIKIYEEYFEQLLFCRFFIAEQLKHNAEMGRSGETVLLRQLSKRFSMLEFVTGFIICNNQQSPQCDILVCRKNMYKRQLDGEIFLVNPKDCLMVIEVKSNITLADLSEIDTKNLFFRNNNEMKHIQLVVFAYKSRIGKKTLMSEFGFKYSNLKAYIQTELVVEKNIDIFICLHRTSLNNNSDRSKQIFFIKDKQEPKKYVFDSTYPVITNLLNYLHSMQS